MLESMHIDSINVGQAEELQFNGESFTSGIRKRPVAGAVYLDESGVRGDAIVNLQHHGGPDQAVYAYSADDYLWWAQETGREYYPGQFGENLTIRGMPSDMNIGDRLLIGEVVLEATAPRIPCATFAAGMQDSGIRMAFREAERPGVYFRVLNSGEITTGDAVTLVGGETGVATVLDLFRCYYAEQHDESALLHLLEAPLAQRFREKVESKLASLQKREL